MRYSYEYKKMCVELYRQGKWVETPEGVKEKNFRNMIQIWARTEESCGVEALRHKNQNKVWTAEEKYELVAKVLAGESNRTTAIAAGIDKGLLYSWVRCYKMKGYQGLVAQRQGRPPKEPDMRKKIEPAELTPSEREEMIRLRAENERLRAEIAVVKKRLPYVQPTRQTWLRAACRSSRCRFSPVLQEITSLLRSILRKLCAGQKKSFSVHGSVIQCGYTTDRRPALWERAQAEGMEYAR